MSELATDVTKKGHVLTGRVVSNKMTDTIVVLLTRRVKHPRYHKYIQRRTKIHAHDQGNRCKIGDLVSISSCRPMSKTKSWVLVDVLEQTEG